MSDGHAAKVHISGARATRFADEQHGVRVYGVSFAGGRSPAWMVCIARQGVRFAKRFSLARFGDKATALREAVMWRDDVLQTVPPLTRRQAAVLLRTSNKSGVPGVRRREDHAAAWWEAVIDVNGKRRTSRRFRVDEFGEDGAKQRAIEARLRFLAMTEDAYVCSAVSDQEMAEIHGPAPATSGEFLSPVRTESAKRLARRLALEARLVAPPSPAHGIRRRSYPSTGDIWEAWCRSANGKTRFRRFAIRRHGEEQARLLAERALRSLLPAN